MSKNSCGWSRPLWALLALSVTFFSFDTFAAAQNRGDQVGGHFLYTESNSTAANYVLGYRIGPGGQLTELPDSPYPTGGVGDGIPAPNGDSDHGVATQDGRFLLVSNRGSNTISVFRIHKDGGLTQVEGSPFEAGITPVSIAVHGNLVFVLDFGTGEPKNCFGCGYRGYRIRADGRLIPLLNTVVSLEADPSPAPFSIHFSPDGHFLIGTELAASKINVFRVERGNDPLDVRITPVSGSPFTSLGNQPFGINFSPIHPDQFFVANTETTHVPFDRPGDVTSYSLDKDGNITPLVQSPAPDGGQNASCWVAMTHNGKFLFTTNTASSSVSAFSVSADGQLTLLSVTPIPRAGLPPTGLIGPTDPVITPDDGFLFVPTLGVATTVMGFKIGPGGELTPIEMVPITIPHAIPMGMVFVDTSDNDYTDEERG